LRRRRRGGGRIRGAGRLTGGEGLACHRHARPAAMRAKLAHFLFPGSLPRVTKTASGPRSFQRRRKRKRPAGTVLARSFPSVFKTRLGMDFVLAQHHRLGRGIARRTSGCRAAPAGWSAAPGSRPAARARSKVSRTPRMNSCSLEGASAAACRRPWPSAASPNAVSQSGERAMNRQSEPSWSDWPSRSAGRSRARNLLDQVDDRGRVRRRLGDALEGWSAGSRIETRSAQQRLQHPLDGCWGGGTDGTRSSTSFFSSAVRSFSSFCTSP